MNGMNTPFEEAYKTAENMTQEQAGAATTLFYRGTKGFITDMIENILCKFGITAPYQKQFAHYKAFKMNENPLLETYTKAHSAGGMDLMKVGAMLTPEMRQRMHVATFGSATLIPDRYFAEATNYVSRYDPAPATSAFCYMKARMGMMDNVIFLQPTSLNPLREHSILGDTYWSAVVFISNKWSESH